VLRGGEPGHVVVSTADELLRTLQCAYQVQFQGHAGRLRQIGQQLLHVRQFRAGQYGQGHRWARRSGRGSWRGGRDGVVRTTEAVGCASRQGEQSDNEECGESLHWTLPIRYSTTCKSGVLTRFIGCPRTGICRLVKKSMNCCK